MKFLTQKQKVFLLKKQIEVGGDYSFPVFGFHYYETKETPGRWFDCNPFTRSLGSESFKVQSIDKEVGLCYGNFTYKPKSNNSFYMDLHELQQRSIFEIIGLAMVTILPFMIYNFGCLFFKK